MKKRWITKSEITKILSVYSIRKDEFRPVGSSGYFYQSQVVKGYTLSIEQEKSESKDLSESTGRIIVTHSQHNGRKTYKDIWQRDQDGVLQFKFRNLWNQPVSDSDYIRDLESQNQHLILEGQKLHEQHTVNVHNESQNLISDTSTDNEIKSLKIQFEELNKKYHKLKNDTSIHNARGAGRKPSKERLDSIDRVKDLLESGCSDQAVMDKLGISRATFYRYKKCIKNTNIRKAK